MKNKKFLVNVDKDTLCFFVTVLFFSGLAVAVATTECVVNKEDIQGKRSVSAMMPCDGTVLDVQLPARTNTGDTLYVLGHSPKDENSVYVQKTDGTKQKVAFDGAERVNAGDTVVVNSKHKFLMKNITQRNLERQK